MNGCLIKRVTGGRVTVRESYRVTDRVIGRVTTRVAGRVTVRVTDRVTCMPSSSRPSSHSSPDTTCRLLPGYPVLAQQPPYVRRSPRSALGASRDGRRRRRLECAIKDGVHIHALVDARRPHVRETALHPRTRLSKIHLLAPFPLFDELLYRLTHI